MLKVFNRKPSKLIVDRRDVETLLTSIVVYLEAGGDCWDEVLATNGSEASYNLSLALRKMAKEMQVDLGGSKEFDY